MGQQRGRRESKMGESSFSVAVVTTSCYMCGVASLGVYVVYMQHFKFLTIS